MIWRWIFWHCSVKSFSSVWLFVTPWAAACQASLSFTISCSLLKFMSIESVMPSNHHSSSVFPFSSCLQSFPASESSPMSWLFASGSQSTGAWTSASLLPMNIQSWFPLGLTGLISLLSKELSKSILHYSLKTSVLQCSAFFMIHLLHPSITTGHIALTMQTFVSKIMSLLFNMLSRFVIDFLPGSKCVLILWLQSPSDDGKDWRQEEKGMTED